ncbi:MAG: hypothetical protein KJ971_01995 [Firmicutes bacterium]|nr:hypothetical protein [Bacillota bacterium]
MTISEIGFDFNKIQTATISRKNLLLNIILLIFFPTLLFIFITFFILYLAQIPMDFNEVPMEFTDPEYQQFFLVFFLSLGSILLLILLILVLSHYKAPKPYLYLSTNLELEQSLYLIDRKKEMYLDNKIMISLYKSSNQIFSTIKPLDILTQKNTLLFWLTLDQIKDYKIIHKKNRTTLKFTVGVKGRTNRKIYNLFFDDSGNIKSVSELIYSSAYGNSNIKSYKRFYFSNINTRSMHMIHPLIQKELLKKFY